ncbi:hypothetical protein AB0K93_35755 [Streptomyces sp. NPDC052676]|uniref:hypothetical protein n=1 Tax=Streptomyces sp. NPDC052676 TaxID=3154953 RepID=UPI0034417FAD
MRSARMLLVTAGATAALALGAPGAYADDYGSDREGSSYSKEQEKDSTYDSGSSSKDGTHESGGYQDGSDSGSHKDSGYGKDSYGEKESYGEKDSYGEKESYEEKESYGEKSYGEKSYGEKSYGEKDSWGSGHDKPRGGMHTGGGALSAPTVTAGGLGVLAAAGLGLYAARRKRSVEGAV